MLWDSFFAFPKVLDVGGISDSSATHGIVTVPRFLLNLGHTEFAGRGMGGGGT